jgi:plasmid stabilization system protein ParE
MPGAENDFEESFDWYFERSEEAAIAFSDEVEAALAVIATDPMRFASIDRQHRECRLDRFPFRVVFRITTDRIQVIAVAHTKRQRFYWRRRT